MRGRALEEEWIKADPCGIPTKSKWILGNMISIPLSSHA
jgi:hypothetical protein